MFGTRSSVNWDTQPGKFDVLNLRMRFDSTSAWEIPDLAPTDFVPSSLAAWNMPRHRDHAALTGGALHFFLDDYRFETVWSSPERLFDRVKAVGAALTPDFSLWTDMPKAAQVWNVYRSRWIGAYWQSQGIEVIPTACWATPDTFEFCFDGIPEGSTVAISSMGIQSKKAEQALFREGVRALINSKQPRMLLAYGRLRYCDDIDLPEVREYPTFWDRRRKQVSEAWEDVAQAAVPAPEAESPGKPAPPRNQVLVEDPQAVHRAVADLQAQARVLARETLVPRLVG
ncbi:hypothetical protein SEA_CHARM_1 [Mycobacterium phage Charm]|nr:hypothetical protein SEA_CHARM_1 [Mycobacterium phage Charm]